MAAFRLSDTQHTGLSIFLLKLRGNISPNGSFRGNDRSLLKNRYQLFCVRVNPSETAFGSMSDKFEDVDNAVPNNLTLEFLNDRNRSGMLAFTPLFVRNDLCYLFRIHASFTKSSTVQRCLDTPAAIAGVIRSEP